MTHGYLTVRAPMQPSLYQWKTFESHALNRQYLKVGSHKVRLGTRPQNLLLAERFAAQAAHP